MSKTHSLEKIVKCEKALIEYFDKWEENKEWNSSAENLDKQLAEKGYHTSYKFSHQYKFPEEKTNEEYEGYINGKYRFYLNVNKKNITKLENTKEGSLLAATKQHILGKIPVKKTQMKKDLEALEKLNPEISEIKFDKKSFNEMFYVLSGITYNFKPQDINSFIEKIGNKKEDISFNQKVMEETGLNVSYILSEEHQNKLSAIIEGKKQNDSHQGFIQFQKQRGFYDD